MPKKKEFATLIDKVEGLDDTIGKLAKGKKYQVVALTARVDDLEYNISELAESISLG